MNDAEYWSTLRRASIPLRKLDHNLYPAAVASGGLVDYHGKRLILTVQHATGDMGNWAVEVRFEPGSGTQLYQIGAMNFLKIGDIASGTPKDVDFSYAQVPGDLKPMQQEVSLQRGMSACVS